MYQNFEFTIHLYQVSCRTVLPPVVRVWLRLDSQVPAVSMYSVYADTDASVYADTEYSVSAYTEYSVYADTEYSVSVYTEYSVYADTEYSVYADTDAIVCCCHDCSFKVAEFSIYLCSV